MLFRPNDSLFDRVSVQDYQKGKERDIYFTLNYMFYRYSMFLFEDYTIALGRTIPI